MQLAITSVNKRNSTFIRFTYPSCYTTYGPLPCGVRYVGPPNARMARRGNRQIRRTDAGDAISCDPNHAPMTNLTQKIESEIRLTRTRPPHVRRCGIESPAPWLGHEGARSRSCHYTAAIVDGAVAWPGDS